MAQRMTLSEQLASSLFPLRSSFTDMMRGCVGSCRHQPTCLYSHEHGI